jgi:hypothetical protein
MMYNDTQKNNLFDYFYLKKHFKDAVQSDLRMAQRSPLFIYKQFI